MKGIVHGMLAAAVAACTFTLPALPQSDQPLPREERMRHSAADRETMIHAKLADMKIGLTLRPEQENLWTAFESAITSAFKSHTKAQTAILDAARPLYGSLDDTQKRNFERNVSVASLRPHPTSRVWRVTTRGDLPGLGGSQTVGLARNRPSTDTDG